MLNGRFSMRISQFGYFWQEPMLAVAKNVGWLLLFGNHGLWSKLQNVFFDNLLTWLLPKSNNQPTLVLTFKLHNPCVRSKV
jgi:uncharacterized membrane protein YGL010W